MQSTNTIDRFIQTSVQAKDKHGDEAERSRIRPFVTISRQAGAGGHTVAEELIKVFAAQEDKELFAEWQLFDQNLVEMVANDHDVKISIESLLSEDYHTRTDDFFEQVLAAHTPQEVVMQRMFRIVRSLAEVGKVVIIGRAGSEVTQGLDPTVSVRLVAPEEVRVRRMMELHQLDEKRARELTHKHDAGRARLLKRHFKVDVDDALLYDVTWNTSRVTPQAIAHAITAVLRDRAASFHTVKST